LEARRDAGNSDASLWAAQLSAPASVASAYGRAGSSSPARSLALQQLYAAQHSDGGRGNSPDPGAPSTVARTASVLLALRRGDVASREAGNVPQPAIDKSAVDHALAYLSWQSAAPVSAATTSSGLDDKARALYTLALHGALQADAARPLIMYTES